VLSYQQPTVFNLYQRGYDSGMNQARVEAMKLRLKGYSYNEINKKLGIPKSTLANRLRNVVLSVSARQRLAKRLKIGSLVLIKRNKMQTHLAWKRARNVQVIAKKAIKILNARDILLIGTALYWAEGYKRLRRLNGKERPGHAISFVNSDSQMIRLFLRFIREILDVPTEKIKVNMRLYGHMNEMATRDYWQKITGLPIHRFGKTTWLISISSQRKKPFNVLPRGTLQVEVSNTEKFHRILGYIEGMKSKI